MRGKAQRSRNKEVRIGTHLDVLREVVRNAEVKYIIEHGMGLSSTGYLHGLVPQTLLSFENVPVWQHCRHCDENMPPEMTHRIVEFIEETFTHEIKAAAADPGMTLALIDGPGVERMKVTAACMRLNVQWIVEHDAETFEAEELKARQDEAQTHGYAAYQYTGVQPESVLYMKEPAEFVNCDRYVVL